MIYIEVQHDLDHIGIDDIRVGDLIESTIISINTVSDTDTKITVRLEDIIPGV